MRLPTKGSGYLYNLFHALGVSAATSQHLQSLLDRPLWVIGLIVVTFLVSRLGGRIIRRTLNAMRARAVITDPDRARRIETVSRISTNLWRVIVDAIGFVLVLSVVGLNLTPFLAGATVIGATIGFGAQSLVRDFLSGILMLLEDQYRIGDVVTINEVNGTVDQVSLRITCLRDTDGTEWYIPNGQILKVGNRARHWSRVVIQVQIAMKVDIAAATEVLATAMHEVASTPAIEAKIISEPAVLGVSRVANNAITLDIEVRTQPLVESQVQRALLEAATEALRSHDMLPAEA